MDININIGMALPEASPSRFGASPLLASLVGQTSSAQVPLHTHLTPIIILFLKNINNINFSFFFNLINI